MAAEYSKSVQTHFISTYMCGITIRPKLLKASRDFEYLKLRRLKCFHFCQIAARRKTENHFKKLENPTWSKNPDKTCSLRYCQSW